MIKAIILDMDGVMIDTETQSNLGWVWAANRLGVDMPLWLMDKFKGASPKLCEEYFDEYYKGKQSYSEMKKLRSRRVEEIRQKEPVKAKKGVDTLLKYAKENGLVCAVATSTRKESAEKSLKSIGATEYLSAIVYGDEIENGKPEPDIFLRAADMLGCHPEECVVIEDSINGIKAGHAAHMRVIHVPDTIEFTDEMRLYVSDVCKSLDDVPAVIEAWNRKEASIDVKMNLVYVDRLRVKNFFKTYTARYNPTNPKIKLKIDHTYRVAELCEKIAEAQEMCAYDIELVWLAGMLHDIGRFEQIKRFNTFSDADSVDHAAFGADLLFKKGLIDECMSGMIRCTDFAPTPKQARYGVLGTFIFDRLNKSDIEIIELAIRCHNMYRLPAGLNEREAMFCNVLRDADKIDIFRVNAETPLEDIYNMSTEELENSDITDEVMESFNKEECVLKSVRKTPADIVVGHVSLAFELVYDISVKIMNEQGYLDMLMEFKSQNPNANKKLDAMRKKMKYYVAERSGQA